MMIHRSPIPDGYEIEWRVDPDFSVSFFDGAHRCSFHKCQREAVVILRRRTSRGTRRQWCCSEHMYGREIRYGKVMLDCLVRIEE